MTGLTATQVVRTIAREYDLPVMEAQRVVQEIFKPPVERFTTLDSFIGEALNGLLSNPAVVLEYNWDFTAIAKQAVFIGKATMELRK